MEVHVRGYVKNDGTKVSAHSRSSPGTGGKTGGGAVVAAVLVAAVVAGGGGAGGAAVGAGVGAGGPAAVSGAVDSAAAQSIRARTANARSAARKNQPDQAWRSMGLTPLRQTAQRALTCIVHSHGQVQDFFAHTPCRSLDRTLLALADAQGNTMVVSIAWIRMPTASSARQFKQLIDIHGSGDVYPLASELLELRGIRFTGQHYDSRRSGSLVVIAEAEPASGQPDTELMDGATEVAVHFPPP